METREKTKPGAIDKLLAALPTMSIGDNAARRRNGERLDQEVTSVVSNHDPEFAGALVSMKYAGT